MLVINKEEPIQNSLYSTSKQQPFDGDANIPKIPTQIPIPRFHLFPLIFIRNPAKWPCNLHPKFQVWFNAPPKKKKEKWLPISIYLIDPFGIFFSTGSRQQKNKKKRQNAAKIHSCNSAGRDSKTSTGSRPPGPIRSSTDMLYIALGNQTNCGVDRFGWSFHWKKWEICVTSKDSRRILAFLPHFLFESEWFLHHNFWTLPMGTHSSAEAIPSNFHQWHWL